MRQEGRGIGLHNKIKAYSLQDNGLDTVEANQTLGFDADMRHYEAGAQILLDLGVSQAASAHQQPQQDGRPLWLRPGNPGPCSLEASVNDENRNYLITKKLRDGTPAGQLLGQENPDE